MITKNLRDYIRQLNECGTCKHGKEGFACENACGDSEHGCYEHEFIDEVESDLKELQNIADKWADEKTQRQLYLGRCLETYFEQPYERHSIAVEGAGWGQVIAWSLDEFIEWGKQQGVE